MWIEQPFCLPLWLSQLKSTNKSKCLPDLMLAFQCCCSFRLLQDAGVLEHSHFRNRWLWAPSSYWKEEQRCWEKELSIYFSLDTCIPYKRNHELLIVKPLRMKNAEESSFKQERLNNAVIFTSLSALSWSVTQHRMKYYQPSVSTGSHVQKKWLQNLQNVTL